MNAPALQALREAVGADHVLHAGDLSVWELDWRRRWHGRSLAVVRPGSTTEVAAAVRACAAHGVPIVPQGGNTGLVGGGVPDTSGTQVLMSLQRMQRVRALDDANLTLTAEAGCVLQNLQQAAAARGLLFPLSLAAEGSCTIGGNLATNAGGTQVLRWGNARDLCLGLEVVNAQGQVWDGLTGLRKDNTGYDLRDLFIGSEGTLGIITAATLKLAPQPAARTTALAACASLQACVELLKKARGRLGAGLTGFEVMGQHALDLVAKHFPALPRPLPALPGAPWTVLLEQSDTEGESQARARFEALLGDALDAGCVADAVVAESLAQAQTLWQLRESIPLAQAQEGLNIKHDISLPVSAIPAYVAHTDALLEQHVPGVRLVNFGHLGDGNLHYNVQAPAGDDGRRFVEVHEHAVNSIVFDALQPFGGSFSAEHGIGSLKRDALAARKSPVALQMMRAIKQALDPQGLMNPGPCCRACTAPCCWLLQRTLEHCGHRDGHRLDAFVLQRGAFFRRGVAPDAALRRFAIVDAARFLGETLANVFGLGHQLAHATQPACLDLGGHQGACICWQLRLCCHRRCGLCCHRRLHLARAREVQPWCRRHAADHLVAAHRASHQTTAVLRRVVVIGCKPAFKTMAVCTAQIQHFQRLILRRLPSACRALPMQRAPPSTPTQQHVQANDGFHIRQAACSVDGVEFFVGVHHHFDEFAGVQLLWAGHQATSKPQPNAFVGIGRRVVDLTAKRPFAGNKAGFFSQFTLPAQQRVFARVQAAGGQFQQHFAQRVAPLPHHHHAAVVEQRNHRHGARVQDEFARGQAAIGQRHFVAHHVQKAVVQFGALARGAFAQVDVVRGVGHAGLRWPGRARWRRGTTPSNRR